MTESDYDPRDPFSGLPRSIQEHLVEIGRAALGMSTEEKAAARQVIGTQTLIYAMRTPAGDHRDAIAGMVAGLGAIIAAADAAAGEHASWMAGGR